MNVVSFNYMMEKYLPINPNVNIADVRNVVHRVKVPLVPGPGRTEPDGVNFLNFVHHFQAFLQVLKFHDVVLQH